MNRPIALAAFTILAASVMAPLRAEHGQHGDEAKMAEMHEKKSAQHLERLTKDLNLTTEQQTTVKTALEEKRERMMTLHS
jgi:Spy/CpxP family protein refolding chaperone